MPAVWSQLSASPLIEVLGNKEQAFFWLTGWTDLSLCCSPARLGLQRAAA
jgi:hypothetical protein